MDNRASCKEVSEELARELLIAISYSLPEKVLDSNLSTDTIRDADGVAVWNGDMIEKCRSELISISDAQSPDVKI